MICPPSLLDCSAETQRGVAGAEVVDADAHAEPAQALQNSDGVLGVLNGNAFDDFQSQRVWRDVAGGHRIDHLVNEVGLVKLARRDVDAHGQRFGPREISLPFR